MTKRHVRIPLLSLFVLQVGACLTWQPVDVAPTALLEQGPVERVRVTRPDGVQLTLEAPRIRAGALVATGAPGAVLLEDVTLLEVEATSTIRSVLAVLPAVLILVGVRLQLAR